MHERVRRIAAHFAIPGALRRAEPHGSGHIHETLLAEYEHAGTLSRFLHQRLNTAIFRDPEGLMRNVVRVTDHLRAKILQRGVAEPERRCLQVVRTTTGAPLYVDARGDAWRTYVFIENAHSLDTCRRPEQAAQAARAFGAFVSDLADLDPDTLAETIPGFHDLVGRAEALEAALRADSLGRASGVAAEVERLRAHGARLRRELDARDAASAPRRIVHNDCKINNVLFDDASSEALCVVDLDTVMPGRVLSDFGDLARTATCPAPEDETDLSRVRVDLDLFRALARGYRSGAGALLTPAEARLLPLAGPALALENALRFLSDHLQGDVYFRTHHPGHNLERCRSQLRLLECMLAALAEAQRIVEEARP
ncbi:MAG TPA: phosphotransferase [Myxococcota bacterium]